MEVHLSDILPCFISLQLLHTDTAETGPGTREHPLKAFSRKNGCGNFMSEVVLIKTRFFSLCLGK